MTNQRHTSNTIGHNRHYLSRLVRYAPKCGEDGWVGHEWKMRGFYSDECIHCGTVAVEGINGMKKNSEHCHTRANLLSHTNPNNKK